MRKNEPSLSVIYNIYKQAISNVPILKYSKVLIATICILALIGYFKLKNADVFLYAGGVIIISFIGFIFSLFLNNSDPIIKFLRYLIVGSISLTTTIIILGFGTFVIFEHPAFYKRWFPDHKNTIPATLKNSTITPPVKGNIEKNFKLNPQIKHYSEKIKKQILSIQLGENTDGYTKIFINGKQIPVLAESTKLNPRIKVDNSLLNKQLLIITTKGDTCISLLPSQIDSSMIRFIPNCN